MSEQPCGVYIISPSDPGITYLSGGTRLFNFQAAGHGDHVHVDMSVHLVGVEIDLGGGRCLTTMRVRDFGACRFRLPVSESEFDLNVLIHFCQTEAFQSFATGPLDDIAGDIDPAQLAMLPD